MAFNHPIEADRVDDLGFFSLFVRGPVEGTLMWILGANESSKSADEEHTEQKPGQQTTSPMDSYNSIGGTNRFTRPRGMRELTKTKPYLIGSDLSEMAEYLENDEASFSDFHRTTSVGSNKTYVHIPTGKKKMSWSDELGRDLVHFIDETKLGEASHRPSNPSKPVKSAMKRSRSIRTNASSIENGVDVSRCIPKGLDSGHGGLLMPTKPYDVHTRHHADAKSSGHVSPEWGWYINTTPPTPEMYHSKQPKPVKKLSYNGSRSSTLTNPAFSQGSAKGAMGWSSIPL